MLPPNTAQPGRSIWAGVGRDTFERDVHALHRTGFVPPSQSLRKEEWPESQKDEILPFSVEKQISDDIAFISAYEYGVQYVTAATVHASEREGLTIRVAANEGVSACVQHALQRIFLFLEECSSKGK
jgi:hypothetical protein